MLCCKRGSLVQKEETKEEENETGRGAPALSKEQEPGTPAKAREGM